MRQTEINTSGSYMAPFNALAQMQQPKAPNALAGMTAQGGQGGALDAGDERSAIDIAGSAMGLNESTKKAALQEYLSNGGQNLDPAVTAWCAAFVDATLAQAGGKGTGKLNARSYLEWGKPVDKPQEGDIAVFSRGDPNGWQGHVGFFKGYNPDGTINVLGGNQGDSVSVAPYSANRLLGFRRG